MPRTVGQIVTTARGILQDVTGSLDGFRYSDNDLALYISEAVQEARRLRADLFLPGSVPNGLDYTIPLYTSADFGLTVPLPDSYATQLVHFVVGRAQLRDDEYSQDSRAATLLAAWGAALTNNGGKR